MKPVQSVAKNPLYGHIGITQRAVIEDLMNGMNKYDVLHKHKVNPARYNRWLQNETYRKALVDRIDSLQRQHKFIAVNALPAAVRRLGELIDSEKDETARKACLDIIALQKENAADDAARKAQEDSNPPKISDEKAARMLAILAEPDLPPNTEQSDSVGSGLAPARFPESNQYQVPGTEYTVNRHHVSEFPSPDPNVEYLSYSERLERNGWRLDCPLPPAEQPVGAVHELPSNALAPALETVPGVATLAPEQIGAGRNENDADESIRRHAENIRRTWKPARHL